MEPQAPNIKHPKPDLPEKIERVLIALSELSDALPEGKDRNSLVEQLEVLNVERQSEPISLAALKKVCKEVSTMMGRIQADVGTH